MRVTSMTSLICVVLGMLVFSHSNAMPVPTKLDPYEEAVVLGLCPVVDCPLSFVEMLSCVKLNGTMRPAFFLIGGRECRGCPKCLLGPKVPHVDDSVYEFEPNVPSDGNQNPDYVSPGRGEGVAEKEARSGVFSGGTGDRGAAADGGHDGDDAGEEPDGEVLHQTPGGTESGAVDRHGPSQSQQNSTDATGRHSNQETGSPATVGYTRAATEANWGARPRTGGPTQVVPEGPPADRDPSGGGQENQFFTGAPKPPINNVDPGQMHTKDETKKGDRHNRVKPGAEAMSPEDTAVGSPREDSAPGPKVSPDGITRPGHQHGGSVGGSGSKDLPQTTSRVSNGSDRQGGNASYQDDRDHGNGADGTGGRGRGDDTNEQQNDTRREESFGTRGGGTDLGHGKSWTPNDQEYSTSGTRGNNNSKGSHNNKKGEGRQDDSHIDAQHRGSSADDHRDKSKTNVNTPTSDGSTLTGRDSGVSQDGTNGSYADERGVNGTRGAQGRNRADSNQSRDGGLENDTSSLDTEENTDESQGSREFPDNARDSYDSRTSNNKTRLNGGSHVSYNKTRGDGDSQGSHNKTRGDDDSQRSHKTRGDGDLQGSHNKTRGDDDSQRSHKTRGDGDLQGSHNKTRGDDDSQRSHNKTRGDGDLHGSHNKTRGDDDLHGSHNKTRGDSGLQGSHNITYVHNQKQAPSEKPLRGNETSPSSPPNATKATGTGERYPQDTDNKNAGGGRLNTTAESGQAMITKVDGTERNSSGDAARQMALTAATAHTSGLPNSRQSSTTTNPLEGVETGRVLYIRGQRFVIRFGKAD